MNGYRKTIGALIGLARTAYSDPHSPELLTLMCEVLAAGDSADKAVYSTMQTRIRDMKRQYAPGCADCAAPCGRTADFDMHLLNAESEETRNEKYKLLDALHQFGQVSGGNMDASAEQLLFDCLGVIEEPQRAENIRSHLNRLQAYLPQN